MQDEVADRKAKLNKIIDQGGKVEYLFSQAEFQFFLTWINTLREEYKNRILNGTLLTNLREEDHAKGAYTALTKVVEAADAFASKAKKARNQLKKLDEDLDNMPEALR